MRRKEGRARGEATARGRETLLSPCRSQEINVCRWGLVGKGSRGRGRLTNPKGIAGFARLCLTSVWLVRIMLGTTDLWSLTGAPRCQAKNAVRPLSCIQKRPEASKKEMKLLSSRFWEILRLSVVTNSLFKLR